jgi:hypothetical protein
MSVFQIIKEREVKKEGEKRNGEEKWNGQYHLWNRIQAQQVYIRNNATSFHMGPTVRPGYQFPLCLSINLDIQLTT